MFSQPWYVSVPDAVLLVLMVAAALRFLLGIAFSPRGGPAPWRIFCRLTDPFIALARVLSPALISSRLMPAFAVLWLFFIRLLLLGAFAAADLFVRTQAGQL